MVIIILTNQLTLTLAILIIILQSNVLTNSYFPAYPTYSFKSFDPPWRPRRSFITLTRPRRSFGEGREGNDKKGKFGGQTWGSREAMAWRCGLGARRWQHGAEWNREGVAGLGRGPILGSAMPWAVARHCRALMRGATELATSPVSGPGRCHVGSLAAPHAWRDSVNLPRRANRRDQKC